MAAYTPPTPGLMVWNPTSTAQSLGMAKDVVRDFNASGSMQTTTGSITAGSNALTLASPIDFSNGQGITVQGAGAGGALLVTTIVGGAGTTALTLAASAGTTVTDALVQHDDSWAWQAAIDSATTPMIIQCPPGTSMNIAATLQLKSNISLAFPKSTLIWTGPSGSPIFTSSTAAPLFCSGIIGGYVNPGNAGQVINLHSPQYCTFDLEILDGSTALTVMRWAADAQSNGPLGTPNATGNMVCRLIAGKCGTLLDLAGTSTGAITLNTFLYLEGSACQTAGIVCESSGYVNNNTFITTNLILPAANGVGVDLGQSNSAPNIFNLVFVTLLVNNTSGANCTGLSLRNSSKLQVQSYSYVGFPPGTTVDSGQAVSYYIRDTGIGSPPAMQDTTQGWSVSPIQIGASGTPIKNHLSSYQLVAPIAVPPQSGTTASAQVSGANTGDTVIATPNGMIPPGISWNATVLSDGVVTLYISNPTMVAIPVPQMNWRIDIWQY